MQGADIAATGGQAAEQQLAVAHRALLKTSGLQFDFAPAPPPPDVSWLQPFIRFLTFIGPVLKYVFWGGLIAGAALILYLILRELVPDSWFRKPVRVVPPSRSIR